ncbi:MAG: hypothetical protein N4A72_18265 [Bacteroidales bacterium]|jgi:hypothetical protein|nr:hypothetical protein [Bacteroidales bacterium]
MNDNTDIKDTLSYNWANSLVGTRTGFVIIMALCIGFGGFYSFNFIKNFVPLIMIGIVSNTIFMYCTMKIIANSKTLQEFLSLPDDIINKKNMNRILTADVSIIAVLNLLILSGILNNVFFKFLMVVILPVIQLIFLRVVFNITRSLTDTD